MKKPKAEDLVNRIIDVNINRLTEGLRVTEEIVRFAIEDKKLLTQIRNLHNLFTKKLKAYRLGVIMARKAETDLGRTGQFDRIKRKGLTDVLLANLKRSEEAARVLEEISKINQNTTTLAPFFKKVRFNLYELEKKLILKIRE
ncbi:MAG: thiamine-phosphate pyrophosphorylase [candidate division WOR-3 bacterium]